MEIKKIVVGVLKTNCYVVIENNHCLIIDPGDEANKIKKIVENYDIDGILITHHHFDHIGALNRLKEEFHLKVYDFENLKEGLNKIGIFTFEVIRTPGHKEDAISFLFENNMFVGDFIFKDSIGRTDLDGGSIEEMEKSIRKIKQYSPEIILYPGHGSITCLKDEIQNNLYFK